MSERWPTDYEIQMIHACLLIPSAKALRAMRREVRAAGEDPEVAAVELAVQVRRLRGVKDPEAL